MPTGKAQETLRSETAADGRAAGEPFRAGQDLQLTSARRSCGLAPRPGASRARAAGRRSAAAQEAVENNRQALEILEGLTAEAPDNPRYRLAMARSQRDRSAIAAFGGRRDEAEQARQEAIRILEKLVADFPHNPDYRYELAETYAMPVPARAGDRGRRPPASNSAAPSRSAPTWWPATQRSPSTGPRWPATTCGARGSRGRPMPARLPKATCQGSRPRSRLVTEFPSVTAYRFSLGRSLHQLAEVQNALHEPAKARASLEEAIANSEKIQAKRRRAAGPAV